MKNTVKFTAAATLAAITAATAGMAGCGNTKTGEAWGVSHGGGYVAYVSITTDGDKVKELTLREVCLPTYVQAGEDVPQEDKVAAGNKTYYKKVSYGSVTAVYDEAEGYKVGDKKLAEYLFESQQNAKAYYDAVMNGGIEVTVNGSKDGSVMTKSALDKEENGYWTREDASGAEYSRWKWNRDATVAYVKANGIKNLKSLVRSETKEDDPKSGAQVNYWYDGKINTGATWTDFNTTKESTYSYAQLILNATQEAK